MWEDPHANKPPDCSSHLSWITMEILPRYLCWWHVLCHCIAEIHILKLYRGMQARPMNLWLFHSYICGGTLGSANYRATVSSWHLLWYWKGYQPVQPINNMVMTCALGRPCCCTKVPSVAIMLLGQPSTGLACG